MLLRGVWQFRDIFLCVAGDDDSYEIIRYLYDRVYVIGRRNNNYRKHSSNLFFSLISGDDSLYF